MCVLFIHFKTKSNSFNITKIKLKISSIIDILSLGLSAFITEFSSAIVLITFNLIILNISGNIGIASYGIVANLALVGIAIFTGISQGMQPLISKTYGLEDYKSVNEIIKYALITSIVVALLMYIFVFALSDWIVSGFNSENNLEIATIAKEGLRIYFIGIIFAGINIISASFLSATEFPKKAFLISSTRGFILILPLVFLLSNIFQMTGVWLSFVVTEIIVFVISIQSLNDKRNRVYKETYTISRSEV